MAIASHESIPINSIHAPYSFIYVDESARISNTNFVLDDKYKFALQKDNNSIWMLTNNSPVEWKRIS